MIEETPMLNVVDEIERRMAVDEPATELEFKMWTDALCRYVKAAEAWMAKRDINPYDDSCLADLQSVRRELGLGKE